MDASFLLRRSRLGDLTVSGLKKKRLELFDLLDNLCLDTYTRHDDEPTVRHDVCAHMWEEDEDEVIDTMIAHSKQHHEAVKALCIDKFAYCTPQHVERSRVHHEL